MTGNSTEVVHAKMRTRNSVIKRVPNSDPTSKYDYCMVFKLTPENNQTDYSKYIVKQMKNAGLDLMCYWSVQRDEIIVLIRCPTKKMREFAHDNDFLLELEPTKVKELLNKGVIENGEYVIKPVHINDSVEYSPLSPYDYIYAKFQKDVDLSLYAPYEYGDKVVDPSEEDVPFNKFVRLKLIYNLLQAPLQKGGCDLEMSKLIANNTIECFYPLHDSFARSQLCEKITRYDTFPWTVPFDDVRFYFGEKITLYQIFLGHYSYWLIIPAVIGAIFQIVVWGTNNFSHPVLPFYCLIITVWSIVMLEHWKQKEKMTALKWGMTDYEAKEPDRPEYRGFLIDSFVDGEPMLFFPQQEANGRFLSSQTVITACACLVIGVVSSIYVLRFTIQNDVGVAASFIASILNTVQIVVFNMIYQQVALYLTDMENHRTATQYEDALIGKLFLFQFINSYSSFFFLAFIAEYLSRPNGVADDYVGQCGASSCMQPLSINLAIIFGTRLFLNNLVDLVMARYKADKKRKEETTGTQGRLTPAEEDYILLEYNATLDNISSFADTAIQFGFATLFISALPIASFLSLFSNYVKVKMLAWKLCKFYQRPIPLGAEDIGVWLVIFQLISVVSVVTNAGLICFTMDTLDEYTAIGRVWIFIGFQWALISIQFFAERVIPDEPAEAVIQIERMEFITSKLIDRVRDDDPISVEEYETQQRIKKIGGGNKSTTSAAGAVEIGDEEAGRQSMYSYVFGSQLQQGYIKERNIRDCPDISVQDYSTLASSSSQTSSTPMTSNPMLNSPVQN